MEEISLDYWNKLANQIIVISSLMSGFSIAVIANLLVSDTNTRLSRGILKTAVLAASFFLISVFAMTNVLMMSTEGFPLEVSPGEFKTSMLVGASALLFGIISLLTLIALSGWTKSKVLGRFTTIVGVITFIIVLIMLA